MKYLLRKCGICLRHMQERIASAARMISYCVAIFHKKRQNYSYILSHSTTRGAPRVFSCRNRLYCSGVRRKAECNHLVPEENVCGSNICVFPKQPLHKTVHAFRLLPCSVCAAPAAAPSRFVDFRMCQWIMHLQTTCVAFVRKSRWNPVIF